MTDKGGGQAFPIPGTEDIPDIAGMSNRDWLEGMAITGVIDNLLVTSPSGFCADDVAERVEAIANAILKRRALREKP